MIRIAPALATLLALAPIAAHADSGSADIIIPHVTVIDGTIPVEQPKSAPVEQPNSDRINYSVMQVLVQQQIASIQMQQNVAAVAETQINILHAIQQIQADLARTNKP